MNQTHLETAPARAPLSQDALLEDIKAKLAQFVARETELFRTLCRLARDWNVQPERFRGLLKAADLPASRATEIKLVLLFPDLRDRFLLGAPWKATLEAARDLSPGALDRAGLKLAYLLDKEGHHWPDGQQYGGWVLERYVGGNFRFTGPWGTLDVLRTCLETAIRLFINLCLYPNKFRNLARKHRVRLWLERPELRPPAGSIGIKPP